MFNLQLEPLINQIKSFTQVQQETNKLLTEILKELKNKN
jgi:hypothetical protein